MQVKIIKCSDNTFWYFDKIGEVFNVIYMNIGNKPSHYFYEINNKSYLINLDDARIINRRDKIEKILNRNSCK
jgi:hypothetical protein